MSITSKNDISEAGSVGISARLTLALAFSVSCAVSGSINCLKKLWPISKNSGVNTIAPTKSPIHHANHMVFLSIKDKSPKPMSVEIPKIVAPREPNKSITEYKTDRRRAPEENKCMRCSILQYALTAAQYGKVKLNASAVEINKVLTKSVP
jgi:hypothetical protein